MQSVLLIASPQRMFLYKGSRKSRSSLEPVFRGIHFRMRIVVPSVAISRVLPLRMPVSLRISAGMMMRPWVSMFRITAILIKTVLSLTPEQKKKRGFRFLSCMVVSYVSMLRMGKAAAASAGAGPADLRASLSRLRSAAGQCSAPTRSHTHPPALRAGRDPCP